ncbi:MAG: type II/IV secretion system protein [Chlorobi bacterium]|nr:type II/IV secretion system protein [Chlorobiota bacterium]
MIESINIPTEVQQQVTPEQAWHYHIIPKLRSTKIFEFYIDESKNLLQTTEELEMLFDENIKLIIAPTNLILKSLSKYYRKSEASKKRKNTIKADINRDDFLLFLINEANSIDSSDIHIEIYEKKCRVRLRIDGKLVERYVLKREEYPALINKIKIKANLDISEKRLPQDGRIFFTEGNNKFDIRVSILPTLHGEKIVLRLLSKDATEIDIKSLGFNSEQITAYLEGIKKPHGIILISGPTGSGKTTTLYATLKILNKEQTNILTIEDPIEYTLEGINQVQLKENIGLTFAAALRTFLRQDPDVIMLGEIRDGETAQMAIRAALTGHLVLSTVHTNSAWGTVSRLIDMGVPPFLLASTLSLSVAQRLIRILCPHCKKEEEFNNKLYPNNYKPPRKITKHFVAVGCEHCFYTGFKGRKAVYEVIPVDTGLSENIKENNFNIVHLLKERGLKSLADEAFSYFEKGETAIEEIYAILLNS